MPTGGGKSLCFQIPALVRDGVGIIVSPLIALMKDQVDALLELGIKAAYLNSTLNSEAQKKIEQQLLSGDIDLLYIAPERLLTHRSLQLLKKVNISLFAIDEAHCVSQWGHDFRKDYQQLRLLHEHFPHIPRVALTATADKRTRQEIIEQLNLQGAKVFINSFDRSNIRYEISDGQNNRQRLWRFIEQEHANDAGIVYCLSRKNVESVSEFLSSKGRTALPYHAGLPSELRDLHQQRFLREEGIIVVATIAFGMGIDKPDVRFVAHLNLPKSIEAYYQETGRAGRDGNPANAWLAYGLQDVITLRQMMLESDANEQIKRVINNKLEAMLGLSEQTSCRRQTLLSYFDEVMDEPCGNCDNCLKPPETWDATEVSRKAMSCVYRTGQRFGVNYVIDVLHGKEDDRIQQFEHDQLSTFGIGKEINAVEWRGVFRQLIAQGFIAVDVEGFGALKLTDKAGPLLRGEITLLLRKQLKQEKQSSAIKNKNINLRSFDESLFVALKELRMNLANDAGVPPFVVFHDKTLLEMVSRRPKDKEQFQYISGVGESKLKKYGDEFLAVIAEFKRSELLENQLSNTVNESLHLFIENNSVDQIATTRELGVATVYSHLADAIAAGLLDIKEVVDIDEETIAQISNVIEMFIDDEPFKMKTVFEALDQQFDYGILKCVQAGAGFS